MITVRITKRDPRAQLPEYQTAGAAAFDLAIIEDAVVAAAIAGVAPDRTRRRPSGRPRAPRLRPLVALQEARSRAGERRRRDRSGLLADRTTRSCSRSGTPATRTWSLTAGTRVAQGIILARPRVTWVEGDADGTDRGGFGSTGTDE